jgi:hypothetical protein
LRILPSSPRTAWLLRLGPVPRQPYLCDTQGRPIKKQEEIVFDCDIYDGWWEWNEEANINFSKEIMDKMVAFADKIDKEQG